MMLRGIFIKNTTNENLDRFSNTFFSFMHVYYNIANEISKDLKNHRVTIFNLTDEAKYLDQDRKDLTKNIFRKILKPFSKEGQIKLIKAFETILHLMQRIGYKRDNG